MNDIPFVRVEGRGLVDAREDAFFIRGTNLGAPLPGPHRLPAASRITAAGSFMGRGA